MTDSLGNGEDGISSGVRGRCVPRYKLRLDEVREGVPSEPELMNRPAEVAKIAARDMEGATQELMWGYFLDSRNRIIGSTELFRGTINRMAVEPRQVLQAGLLMNALGIVIAHNHPSGDPSPSPEDISFTRRLAEAGEIVGLKLLDHLVIGSGGRWVSLKQRGVW